MPNLDSNAAASCLLRTTFDEAVVQKAVLDCRERIGGDPDLVFAFVSSDWEPHLKKFVEILQIDGHVTSLLGASGYGLIGTGQEDENVSGMSLIFLKLPNTQATRVEFDEHDFWDAERGTTWPMISGVDPSKGGGWITLGNPMLFACEAWLHQWNTAYSGIPCFGGLASGGIDEGMFLFTEKGLCSNPLIGVHLTGGIKFGGVVSQGCRPIGEPFTITEADQNVLIKIAGKPAYEVLENAFHSLDASDQASARGNLLAGLALSEYVDDFKQGDFLVRNILGGDPNEGVIALGGLPRVGQTIQFQLRDRDSADEDLRLQCDSALEASGSPFASLLFSCAGRGTSLFQEPNHDAAVIEEKFGKIPLSGFFCNGEFGPVGQESFVHGFTASAALLLNP